MGAKDEHDPARRRAVLRIAAGALAGKFLVTSGPALSGVPRSAVRWPPVPVRSLDEPGRTDSYLRALNPVDESQYLDYSGGIRTPVVRSRYLRTGASVDRLDELIDYAEVYEPAPDVASINEAIERANARPGGGVVRPRAAEGMIVKSRAVRVLDRVVYDGANIGVHDIRGGDHVAAVEAFEQRDLAIVNVTTDGNGDGCYGVRLEDTVNVLIDNVRTRRHDQNSVATGLRGVDITVRNCRLSPGRDDAGNGTYRDQHGIVSSSFPGPEERAPRGRFGLTYSVGHAWYGNVITRCDGLSMDAHCSNMECMGNWTDDARYGAKFPHSANVLIHHNRFGGARKSDPRDKKPMVLRFYSANDYAVGVGYETDRIFLFANRFEDNHGQAIRFDGIHGTVWLLDNDYGAPEDTRINVAPSNDGSTDPDSFRGRLVVCEGPGVPEPDIASSLEAERVWQATDDERLCAADRDTLVALMNETPDPDWDANVKHPLPTLEPFSSGRD